MSTDPRISSHGGAEPTPLNVGDRATEDLGQLTDQAKAGLDAIKQRGAEDVRELGRQAVEKGSEVVGQAKGFASDQKAVAAGQINGIASAINKVAEELDRSDQATVSRYARDLAGGLGKIGKTIDSHDVDDLIGIAQDFGRTQPVAFLGAAALAGFVASRFALASAHRRDNRSATPASSSQGAAGIPGDAGAVAPLGAVQPGDY